MSTSTSTTSNGGTWEDGKCVCPEGFQGDFCEELICQNGGTWANGFCQCPPNFQGDRCETAKDIVEIKDEPSAAPSPRSSGSIVVDYEVILKIPATSKAEEMVSIISENLVAAIQNYNCSVWVSLTPLRKPQNLSPASPPSDLCDRYIQEEFRGFYTQLLTSAGVICITRCDSRHAEPLPCVHGRCSVGREGPQCECSDQAAFWYQDNACSSRISKVGVAVGVPMAVLVLVACHRGVSWGVLWGSWVSSPWVPPHRKKLRSRSELYSSDDWDEPQGFAMTNTTATWEGNGDGGGDGVGMGWGSLWHPGGSMAPLLPPHRHGDPQHQLHQPGEGGHLEDGG
uniref:Uncharacterized protein n=1 Tax=Geospiza parvula TaxID=87175 RepID=A0A8U8BLZ2_GEOPR